MTNPRTIEGYKPIAQWLASNFGINVTPETVRGWVYKFALPVESFNGRVRISEADLRAFVAARSSVPKKGGSRG